MRGVAFRVVSRASPLPSPPTRRRPPPPDHLPGGRGEAELRPARGVGPGPPSTRPGQSDPIIQGSQTHAASHRLPRPAGVARPRLVRLRRRARPTLPRRRDRDLQRQAPREGPDQLRPRGRQGDRGQRRGRGRFLRHVHLRRPRRRPGGQVQGHHHRQGRLDGEGQGGLQEGLRPGRPRLHPPRLHHQGRGGGQGPHPRRLRRRPLDQPRGRGPAPIQRDQFQALRRRSPPRPQAGPGARRRGRAGVNAPPAGPRPGDHSPPASDTPGRSPGRSRPAWPARRGDRAGRGGSRRWPLRRSA